MSTAVAIRKPPAVATSAVVVVTVPPIVPAVPLRAVHPLGVVHEAVEAGSVAEVTPQAAHALLVAVVLVWEDAGNFTSLKCNNLMIR